MNAKELGRSDARYEFEQWTKPELIAWDNDDEAVYPIPTWDYPTLTVSVDDQEENLIVNYQTGFMHTWDALLREILPYPIKERR